MGIDVAAIDIKAGTPADIDPQFCGLYDRPKRRRPAEAAAVDSPGG